LWAACSPQSAGESAMMYGGKSLHPETRFSAGGGSATGGKSCRPDFQGKFRAHGLGSSPNKGATGIRAGVDLST